MPTVLCPEIETVLAAIEPQRTTKVLLLGNSGVGKSFLLNVLLQEDEFESKYSGTAVTRATEVGVLQPTTDESSAYLLYNIPGLLDPSERVTAENSRQIESAFRDRGNLPVVTLFVLTVEGGRPRADDLEAWRAIVRFAPDIETETVVAFVVNKMDSDDFENGAQRTNYELNLQRQLHDFCRRPYSVYFLPKLSSKDRASATSEGRAQMRASLMAALRGLRGHAIRIAEGARLKLDYELLKEDIAKTKAQMTAMEERYRLEQQENAKSHRDALAAMQRQNEERSSEMVRAHESEMRALKAQIEELKSRSQAGVDVQLLCDQLAAQNHAMAAMMMRLPGGGPHTPIPAYSGYSPQTHLLGEEDFSARRSSRSSERSSRRHVPDDRSSRSSRAEAPVHNWNTFRTAHKGQGYTIDQMSKKYAKYKSKHQ